MAARFLIEVLHTLAGVIAALLIARIAAWAYPLGAQTIGWIGYVAMAVVIGMSVPNLKAAWATDKGRPADG